MSEHSVRAENVLVGLEMMYDGAWWIVVNNYVHPNCSYTKMNLVPHGRPKESPLAVKIVKSATVLVRKAVDTSHLHFCSAVEMMEELKVMIKEYDAANNLPEKVKLEGCNFQIDSIIIRRQAHEAMMAKFNQLSNEIKMVKKP